MKTFIIVFFSIIALIGLGFGLQYLDLGFYGFFATKYENVRRETFENTQSYIEGKRQDLVKYRLEYLQSKDESTKSALKYTIIQEFANFDKTKLSYELQQFLDNIEIGQ